MGKDNRARLTQCALELFAARGYDAVGVQEIVDAAGVTKPTLYHYFGSKRGLLDALLQERFDILYAATARAAAYSGNLTGTLTSLARTYFDFARANPTFYRLQLALYFAPPDNAAFETVNALSQRQYAQLVALFTRAAEDHGNMRGRQERYAATFIGMINNYIALTFNGAFALNDALVAEAVHQYQHGIYS